MFVRVSVSVPVSLRELLCVCMKMYACEWVGGASSERNHCISSGGIAIEIITLITLVRVNGVY